MDRQKSILVLVVVLSCASICFGKYSGGTGEPNNPYLIATAEDMNAIGVDSNDWDAYFLLIADINLAEYTGTQFNIIGHYPRYGPPFTGVFNGNNHKVWNFTWTSTGRIDIGLFGYVGSGGQIKNLGMENVNVNALKRYGYVVGGLAGDNSGTITNCYSTGSLSGTDTVGGLVGYNDGTISDCYAAGSVSGNECVGGLVGANGSEYYGYYYGTISNCYATGAVDGNDYIGGLVGWNDQGPIWNCYSTCSISGNSRVGGLVGQNRCGNYYTGYIYNCYSVGAIDGNNNVGGLVGYHVDEYHCVWCSFWDVNTSGQSTGAGGEGKTTAEMKTRSTFTDTDAGWDWDFIEIWDIGENQTYPFLRTHPAGDINHDDIVNFYDLAILAGRWLEGVVQ